MKKLSISFLITLMGLGFVSCGEDDSGSSLAAIGEECAQNGDCASNYCEANKCAVPKAENGVDCKVDSDCKSNKCENDKCVANDGLKDDGEACTKNEECKSNKCENDKCVANGGLKDDGEACTKNEECKSNKCENDKCVADGGLKDDGEACTKNEECKSNKCENDKCVANVELKDDGDDCTKNEECKSAVCFGGKCGIPTGTSCTVQDKDACSGNTFVHCNIDLSVGGEDNEGVLEVVTCGESEACVVSDSASGCLAKCDKVGDEKTACDLDSDTGDGGFTRVVSYKCESVNDKLVFVPGESKDCGNALCDTFTNTCTGEAGVGVPCEYDNQCESRYCEIAADAEEGVCAEKKADGSDCSGNNACASGYCKASTGQCTSKAENDAECDADEDCKSNFCSKDAEAEKGKCADVPSGLLENGANCDDSAKCLSAYCDGTVCADKPEAPSVECNLTVKCAEGKICGKDFTCIDKPADKVGFNDACDADADCADGLKCSKQKKCRIAADVDLAGYECTEASVSCQNGVKLTCEEDGWSDPWDPTFSSYTTVCAQDGKVCATSGSVSECMVPCDKVGASYKVCDNDFETLVTYTCTEVDGVKVFVPQAQTCDCRVIPENGSAQCA